MPDVIGGVPTVGKRSINARDLIHVGSVVDGMGPGIGDRTLEPAGEPLGDIHLQTVVTGRGIAVILKKTPENSPRQIGHSVGCSDSGAFVDLYFRHWLQDRE